MASQAPIVIQNENLPIFRGIDGKKAGGVCKPPARAGRQERKALGDLSKVGKAPPAGVGGKAAAALGAGGSKNAAKPTYFTDEEWMKCCEWAKDGIELVHFTGNDMQKLISDSQEGRVRRKVKKAIGALQLSADVLHDMNVPLKGSLLDVEDMTKLEFAPEFLPSTTYPSSKLGEEDINNLLSDLEFEHEPFANCNFDLKLKDEDGNNSSLF